MRKLAPEEVALWKRVIGTVKPMRARTAQEPELRVFKPDPTPQLPTPTPPDRAPSHQPAKAAPAKRQATLDASWERRLARGLVAPESSVDLHGHSLASAHALLDRGLERALARDDRVLLLITGKPPAPESERPHARGAIRAAVGDWLAASRFADRIAAVRNAHPRHGGSGALYIVLRRKRSSPGTRKS